MSRCKVCGSPYILLFNFYSCAQGCSYYTKLKPVTRLPTLFVDGRAQWKFMGLAPDEELPDWVTHGAYRPEELDHWAHEACILGKPAPYSYPIDHLRRGVAIKNNSYLSKLWLFVYTPVVSTFTYQIVSP